MGMHMCVCICIIRYHVWTVRGVGACDTHTYVYAVRAIGSLALLTVAIRLATISVGTSTVATPLTTYYLTMAAPLGLAQQQRIVGRNRHEEGEAILLRAA